MVSHYQILRMTPETDVQGKSEADIIKRIENNYKILLMRAPIIYPDEDERDDALDQMEKARAVLSDPQQREAYYEEHKRILQNAEAEKVNVTYICIEEDEVLSEDFLNSLENDDNEKQ